MPIAESILQTLAKPIIESIASRLSRTATRRTKNERTILDIEDSLLQYVRSTFKWCESFQFLGMDQSATTDRDTISLSLHSCPRQFQIGSAKNKSTTFTELDLLGDSNNYLILGDPGSGKTTTIKRLIRALARTEPVSDEDKYRTPFLLQLREIREFEGLSVELAKAIGLSPTRARNGTCSKLFDQDPDLAMAGILDSSGAILFLDGVDELNSQYRDRLFKDIGRISRNLHCSKIIATCRSGDHTRNLEAFNVLEILPLSDEQIEAISRIWIDNPFDFVNALRKLPYCDAANRPLLLTQMLFLYRRAGTLPEQPSLIYKRIVRLLLEEWDQQRGVVRKSKYSGFDPDQKLEFLAALASHLSYVIDINRFSAETLLFCYRKICSGFNLPPSEGRYVIQEIESHTGIIVKLGDEFEFPHLSMQEFLSAYHIVRSPHSETLRIYLSKRTHPVAVAVAISSEPSKWLSSIILNKNTLKALDSENLVSFLNRLTIERPYFTIDTELGYAILVLTHHFHGIIGDQLLDRVLSLRSVSSSLVQALKHFLISRTESRTYVSLIPNVSHSKEHYYITNEVLTFPIGFLAGFQRKHNFTVHLDFTSRTFASDESDNLSQT